LSSVEIFGCPSGEPIVVDDLPVDAYLSAGIYLPKEQSVLLCGGMACESNICAVQDECFKWHPESGWQPVESLVSPRWGSIFATGPNLDQPEDIALVPIALGGGTKAEIFDNDQQAWVNYRPTDTDYIVVGFCLIQGGSQVYFSDRHDQLNALDLYTWEVTSLGSIPFTNDDESAGRCSMAYINGARGEQGQTLRFCLDLLFRYLPEKWPFL